MKLLCGEEEHTVEARETRAGIEAVVDDAPLALDEVRALGPATFLLRRGEVRETFHCVRDGDVVHLFWRGRAYRLEEETEAVRAAHRHVGGGLETPMPGKVIKVAVAPGQDVKKGDELLVIEAMKMENAIRAPRDGRVAAVRAQVGDMVSPGLVLVELRMNVPKRVTVVEVGPRDGLQNEAAALGVEDKVAFAQALLDAGLPVVEAGAFVSPKWVPQMAGSDDVLRRLRPPQGARTPVLVPNRKGYEAARAAGAREIAVFTAASETFNRKNINASIDESFARFAEFVPDALRDGCWVRGYVSTCFGCPYEGRVDPAKVTEVARRLVEAGCHEVSIGDTIGVAVPTQVTDVMTRLQDAAPVSALAVHFHDTRGTALANVLAALQVGIAIVDSSAGGLGGCPYAPGASGNLATEDLLYMLHGMGVGTGVDLARVAAASRALAPRLGRPLPSRYLQASRA